MADKKGMPEATDNKHEKTSDQENQESGSKPAASTATSPRTEIKNELDTAKPKKQLDGSDKPKQKGKDAEAQAVDETKTRDEANQKRTEAPYSTRIVESRVDKAKTDDKTKKRNETSTTTRIVKPTLKKNKSTEELLVESMMEIDQAEKKRSETSSSTVRTVDSSTRKKDNSTQELLVESVMEIEKPQEKPIDTTMDTTEEQQQGGIPGFLRSLLVSSFKEFLEDAPTSPTLFGTTGNESEVYSLRSFGPDPYAREEDDDCVDVNAPLDADPARLRGLIKKLNAINEDNEDNDSDDEEEKEKKDENQQDDYPALSCGDMSVLLCDFIIIARGETDPKWDLVLKRLQSLSKTQAKEAVEADQSHYHTTPLHLACRRHPPLSVIQGLIKASPQVLSWHDRNGSHPRWLPLHCAAEYRASPEVIQELISWYPPALTAKTKLDMTPLHLACIHQRYHGDKPSLEVIKTLCSNKEVLTCINKEGLTPLDVFLRSVNFLRFHKDAEQRTCFDCAKYLVSQSPLEHGKLIKSIRIAPKWLTDGVLSLREVQQLLNELMTPLVTAILMGDFYLYTLLVVSYTVVANSRIPSRFDDDPDNDQVKSGWHVVLFFIGTCLALRELVHCYTQGLFWWLSNIWNWINGILVVLVFVSGFFMINGRGDDEKIRALCVATAGLVWLIALAFLKSTYLPFSVFISGVIHMFWALVPFTVSVFFVIGAFAQMYYTNTVGTETCQDDFGFEGSAFCSYDTSWLQSYSLFLGGFADFFFTNGGVQDKPGEVEEYYNFGTLVLSLIYAFLVAFLLQSILIAVVSQAWTEVRQRGEVVFWSHRFNFIADVERIRIVWVENFGWFSKFQRRTMETPTPRETQFSKKDGDTSVRSHDDVDSNDSSDKWQVFWELVALTYSNHYDGSVVWEEADRMERLGWASDSRDWKMVESSLWFRRVAFLTPVLLWMVAGLFTFGVVWPKSIRARLFCAPVTTTATVPATTTKTSSNSKNDTQTEEEPRNEETTVSDQQLQDMKESILKEMASLRTELLKEIGRIQ